MIKTKNLWDDLKFQAWGRLQPLCWADTQPGPVRTTAGDRALEQLPNSKKASSSVIWEKWMFVVEMRKNCPRTRTAGFKPHQNPNQEPSTVIALRQPAWEERHHALDSGGPRRHWIYAPWCLRARAPALQAHYADRRIPGRQVGYKRRSTFYRHPHRCLARVFRRGGQRIYEI